MTDDRSRRSRGTRRVALAAGVSVTGVVSAALILIPGTAADAIDQPVGDATALVETDPVAHAGDAADDPAIWVHPTDPSLSVVIGNDKGGALEVYDLAGHRIQQINEGFFGNVDVRRGFVTGIGTIDIAVVSRRGIRVYAIDPATRLLANVTDSATGSIATAISGEGLCLYRSPVDGSTHVISNARDGRVNQHQLVDTDGDGLVEAVLRRAWDVGTETEGCVTDEVTGALYISEEAVGIWKYGAEPTAPTSAADRVLVDGTVANGGHIRPDAEGLTIVDTGGGTGYLIASSQAASDTANSLIAYDRQTNAFVRELRVADGPLADGCGRTDGIDASTAALGPAFAHGLFVCQDNANGAPATGNQNFKLVPLERIVGLPGTPPTIPTTPPPTTPPPTTPPPTTPPPTTPPPTTPPPTTPPPTTPPPTTPPPTTPPPTIVAVGTASATGNQRTFRVTVPAAVRTGDGLLLLLATNSLATVGAPTGPAGWTQEGALAGTAARSVVWRTVAGAADAGRAVTVTLSALAKGHLVLLAYRGTSTVDPVAAVASRTDAGGTTAHATPAASVTAPGSWVVSWWTHKDSTTTALVPPGGVVVRAAATQTGNGRVTSLVADSGGGVGAGPVGGLVATAAAGSTSAHAWTLVLAPA